MRDFKMKMMNQPFQITLLAAAALLLIGVSGSRSLADQTSEPAPNAEDGWEILFDGTSTDALRGWKTDKFPGEGYRIEADGSLHAMDGSKDFITRKKYTDFDLRWQWKLSKGANSGVMIRVAEIGAHPHDTGPEYQIIDDPRIHKYSTGSLYDMITPSDNARINPAGKWNTSRIVVKNNNVQHYLNGELIVEYTWASDEIKQLIAKSKFKNWRGFMQQDTGHIGFQSHGKDIWFRDIKIKDLADEGDDK